MSILDTVASQLDDLNTEDAAALDKLTTYYAAALARVEDELQTITAQGGGTTAVADKLRALERTIVEQYQSAGIKASTMANKLVEIGFDKGVQDAHEKIAQSMEDKKAAKVKPPISGSFSDPAVMDKYKKALSEIWDQLPNPGKILPGGFDVGELDHMDAQFQSPWHGTGFSDKPKIKLSDKISQAQIDNWKNKAKVTYSDHYDKNVEAWYHAGWGIDGPKAMLAHEYGHAIQEYLYNEKGVNYLNLPKQEGDIWDYDNKKGHGVQKAYANTNLQEAFAEAYSETLTLPPSEWSENAKKAHAFVQEQIGNGNLPPSMTGAIDQALDDNMKGLLKAGFGKTDPLAFQAFNLAAFDEDSPLAALVKKLPSQVAKAMVQEISFALLTGQNPKVTARKIAALGGMAKNRALTIARTEQLRAYRQATAASYRASNVVKEWVWHASLDRRCCFACLALHGSVWAKDELMRNHPNCRCAMVPRTKSWAELGFPGVDDTNPIQGAMSAGDSPEGFPDVKVNIMLRHEANAWLSAQPMKEKMRIVGGPGQYNYMTDNGQVPLAVRNHLLMFNVNDWGGHFSQRPLSHYGPYVVTDYSMSKALKNKVKAGTLNEGNPNQWENIKKMQAQNTAYKEAAAKKYSSLEAKKAALKKAAADNKALKAQAALDSLKPQGANTPAPSVPGSPSPSTGSQTTSSGKPKPGSPEFKQKVSEAVKAANAKKKAAAEQAAADAAAAQKKLEMEAEAVAQKAMMAAKVSHGVKVANAKKNGTQPPPLPDYAKIKEDAKAAHLAGQTPLKPAPSAKAPKAPAPKQAAHIPKGPVSQPFTGIGSYDAFKANSTANGTEGMWFHATESHYLPIIEKVGFKPQQAGIPGFTGVKITGSFETALGFKHNVIALNPGKLSLAKAENSSLYFDPIRAKLQAKIAKAEAKYGPDHAVTKKLKALDSPSSKYWGAELKKTHGIDGFLQADGGVLLTNMKLANKSMVASYEHTQGVMDALAARAAKEQAAKMAEAKKLAAQRAAERKAQGLTDETFGMFKPTERTKLHNFINTPVDPSRPAVTGTGAPMYMNNSEAAKHSVMTNLSSRLQNDAHWTKYVEQQKIKNPYLDHGAKDFHENVVSDLISQWAGTSFDTNPRAIALQLAAIEEFGLRRAGFDTRLRLSHMDTNTEYIAEQQNVMAYRAFLRAMYEHTQEQFAARGITEVSGYRGSAYWSTDPWTAPSLKSMGREVESDDIPWQPMSSWSSEHQTATGFASGTLGSGGDIRVVHQASIPVSRIIGTTRTGYGCLNEWEIVVMDTEGPVVSKMV